MKKNIMWLVLMLMGAMLNVYAGENNPVKHGNVIRGHVIEKETEEHLPFATILIVETGEEPYPMNRDISVSRIFRQVPIHCVSSFWDMPCRKRR